MNLKCPQCGKRMLMNFTTNVVSCPGCGYVRPDEISQLDEKMDEVRGNSKRPAVQITHRIRATRRKRSAIFAAR
jgi:uncharacterized Zn finger protein